MVCNACYFPVGSRAGGSQLPNVSVKHHGPEFSDMRGLFLWLLFLPFFVGHLYNFIIIINTNYSNKLLIST